jgi:hypothetical protein
MFGVMPTAKISTPWAFRLSAICNVSDWSTLSTPSDNSKARLIELARQPLLTLKICVEAKYNP